MQTALHSSQLTINILTQRLIWADPAGRASIKRFPRRSSKPPGSAHKRNYSRTHSLPLFEFSVTFLVYTGSTPRVLTCGCLSVLSAGTMRTLGSYKAADESHNDCTRKLADIENPNDENRFPEILAGSRALYPHRVTIPADACLLLLDSSGPRSRQC